MNTAILPQYRLFSVRSLVNDVLALAVICLVPALSHLSGIPVYFVEPMRVMLVVAMLASHRTNAFALAIILPLTSFLVSGHPEPVKMMIIMAELTLNTWLFYLLVNRTAKPFLSMVAAIIGSKIFCYALYWVVFSFAFVRDEGGTTFLAAQAIVTVVLSAATWLFLKKSDSQA